MITSAQITVVYRDRANLNDLRLHQMIDAESDVKEILASFLSYVQNTHNITLKNLVRIEVTPIRD